MLPIRNRLTVTAALATVWLTGCGNRPVVHADRATVSGTVTFAGKPLPGGSVAFISTADPAKRVTGILQEDGTFRVADVPVGKVDVAIDTEPMKIGAPKRYVTIPENYRNPATSGLNYDVMPGDNAPARFELK